MTIEYIDTQDVVATTSRVRSI